MKKISNDTKILFYFFSFLIILWIIFDGLKYSWTDDTFQKVILAPLGEEPLKLLVALLFCIAIYCGLILSKLFLKNRKDINYIFNFSDILCYTFLPFTIIYAIIFGLTEGPLYNILLHFSATTIATIFVILIFQKIKDKKWMIYNKVLVLLTSLIIPIILHSISNQYANLTYSDNHQQFECLVVFARFLEKNSFHSGYFILSIFIFTSILLYIFIYTNYLSKLLKRNK